MKHYHNLNQTQLAEVNKEDTVLLMSVSPLEIHGPHLPMGADIIISEGLIERYAQAISEQLPHLSCLKLPPLYLGSDPLPARGSIGISARALERVLLNFAHGLQEQGFRYLLIADNHGGPRHQMALEAASRKAFRKYGFYLLIPFNIEFRYMVQHDAEFLQVTGLQPGCCGDDEDSHAGTNETSLMLALSPENVDKTYHTLPPQSIRSSSQGSIIRVMSRALSKLGFKQFSADLIHLSKTLDWVAMKDMPTYLGAPAAASADAGETMLAARVHIALAMLHKALRGETVVHKPLLWSLRILRRFN